MTRAARHQRLVEQAGLVIDENAKPQIVILGGSEVLIEAAERAEETGLENHR